MIELTYKVTIGSPHITINQQSVIFTNYASDRRNFEVGNRPPHYIPVVCS